MAQALAKLNQRNRAKHHVLAALDEAPRYRDAHRLLLELIDEPAKTKAQVEDNSDADSSDQETESTEQVK